MPGAERFRSRYRWSRQGAGWRSGAAQRTIHAPRDFRINDLSPGERWRLFLALELPAGVRAELAAWTLAAVAGRDGLRAVPEESLHVTLVFLGSTAPGEVARIWSAVPAAPIAPVLAGRELLALPRRRPRVFALGLEDRGGRAADVQRAIAGALGLDEARPWLPHVTLARVRRGRHAGHLAAEAPAPAAFAATAISLLRSHPASRYGVVERRSLRAPGDQRS